MTLVFIDKFGAVWDANSRTFAEHFSIADGLDALKQRFLVRQAGLAAVNTNSGNAALEFVPALTSPAACLSIMDILADNKPDRVAISWFGPNWSHEIYGEWKTAERRVIALAVSKRGDPQPKYISSARELTVLESANPLSRVLDLWRDRGNKFDTTRDASHLTEYTDGRFFVVSRDTGDTGVSFSHAGPGWQAFGQDWGARMVGRDVSHQPDLSYGKWCADCFRNAMQIGRPQITYSDVLVRVPHNPKSKRICYQRITLPLPASHGQPALLSATFVDPDINLRIEI